MNLRLQLTNITKPFFFLLVLFFSSPLYSAVLSTSAPAIDPFTPFASAAEYASPPYGVGSDGILYFDYGSRYDNLGKYKNPTFIAAYANALFRDYMSSRDEELKQGFIRQVEYLIASSESDSRGAYWSYPFENTHYAAPSGWYSGMTSGRVLGVLVRAHYLTQENKYLEFAEKVFDKLNSPLSDGGMITSNKDGVWIEEVAHSTVESYKVLNGHIFGLSGLLAYANYVNSPDAHELVQKAIDAVTNSLDSIDASFLTYYSESVPAGSLKYFAERGGYNVIHVSQMLWLYSVTGLSGYLEKAMRFQGYEVFSPAISTSFSTNAQTNGPEKMNMTFGNNYWSSYKFPVDIVIDLGHSRTLQGLVILGHTPASSPKDYYVEIFNGSDWVGVARGANDTTQRSVINFTHDVLASSVRLRIFTDNGNRSVALDGVGLLLKDNLEAVTNFSNYTSSVSKLFDSDVHSSIVIKNSGFVVIPSKSNVAKISVRGEIIYPLSLTIEGSNDLEIWRGLEYRLSSGHKMANYELVDGHYKYYRLNFSDDYASSLSEIGLLDKI